ncbi:phage virion morphogenesis protein [Pseudomonas coleopterorum]|uniref:Phage virion morphogenesis protein n=1 Tax=Pseudomonas coleopterorum TaxID=1605838 RepID=A0AAJ6M3Q6_9PSED|nr:phage virion morphogenesis protein [Pseudomonas coleopterorum]WNC11646.1 phage virion morphogenesis protein [Pseudomonas coleopterorum]
MSDELEVLEEWAGTLLAKLEPGERRKLLGQVARDLRRNQQRRIAAQKAPDGTAYAPRKRARGGLRGKRGRIRSQMFVKLRTARWMSARTSASELSVGFEPRAARIARIHQYGMSDRTGSGQRVIRYHKRSLLGLTLEDAEAMRAALIGIFDLR